MMMAVEGEGGSNGSVGTTSSVLSLKYDLTHPVEIYSFTESLEGWADLYRLNANKGGEPDKDVRLFIREVRQGSIEVDLIEMARSAGGALAPVAVVTAGIIETVKKATDIISWLSGKKDRPEDVTKKDLEAVSKSLLPVADNHGSRVSISVNNSPGATVLIGSVEANAIQNQATRQLEIMKEPRHQTLREVPLVWHQTDRIVSAAGRTGKKAIVEEISTSPLAVYFSEEERETLQRRMIDDVEFLYQKTFLVDIETIVVLGKLKGIRILRLHDVLD